MATTLFDRGRRSIHTPHYHGPPPPCPFPLTQNATTAQQKIKVLSTIKVSTPRTVPILQADSCGPSILTTTNNITMSTSRRQHHPPTLTQSETNLLLKEIQADLATLLLLQSKLLQTSKEIENNLAALELSLLHRPAYQRPTTLSITPTDLLTPTTNLPCNSTDVSSLLPSVHDEKTLPIPVHPVHQVLIDYYAAYQPKYQEHPSPASMTRPLPVLSLNSRPGFFLDPIVPRPPPKPDPITTAIGGFSLNPIVPRPPPDPDPIAHAMRRVSQCSRSTLLLLF